MFNHLDPYSRYVTAEEAVAARERRIGQRGLGLRLAIGPRRSVVLATVAPGGPAALSRLRPGDRLLDIDGVPVSADDLPDAAARLEGPTGGAVTLTLARGGQRLRVSLLRAPVPPETVTAERIDGILYLRLSAFSQGSASQLVGQITDAGIAGAPRGYVLDLRGNRGGLLPQAAAVADVFLQSGEIMRTEGRHPESGRSWIASGGDLTHGRPLVVLVDGRTASSAEAVAATLGDRGRAVLVGSGTTGKGLVQIVIPLPNAAELLVSWSRLVAPQGWPIQSLGVMPNLCTSLGEEATAAALLMLSEGETPMAVPVARVRAARAPVDPDDAQRLRGPCPPAEGREADLSVARALIERPELYRTALQP
nr:S41 family peptidase [Plastoroseomonas arctica]